MLWKILLIIKIINKFSIVVLVCRLVALLGNIRQKLQAGDLEQIFYTKEYQ